MLFFILDHIREFQSLFYWMVLWKLAIALSTTPKCWFQSLFYWMVLWKTINRYSLGDFNRFQSLFYWMVLWKFYFDFIPIVIFSVSILILLDGTLEDIWGFISITGHKCFNPYFIGWYSGSRSSYYRPDLLYYNIYNCKTFFVFSICQRTCFCLLFLSSPKV